MLALSFLFFLISVLMAIFAFAFGVKPAVVLLIGSLFAFVITLAVALVGPPKKTEL
jgi:hypothetical protein